MSDLRAELAERLARALQLDVPYYSRPLPTAGTPAAVLALRDSLPRKPAPVELTGPGVRLEPLSVDRDVEALFEVSCGRPVARAGRSVDAYDPDALVWRYMSGGPFADARDLAAWL